MDDLTTKVVDSMKAREDNSIFSLSAAIAAFGDFFSKQQSNINELHESYQDQLSDFELENRRLREEKNQIQSEKEKLSREITSSNAKTQELSLRNGWKNVVIVILAVVLCGLLARIFALQDLLGKKDQTISQLTGQHQADSQQLTTAHNWASYPFTLDDDTQDTAQYEGKYVPFGSNFIAYVTDGMDVVYWINGKTDSFQAHEAFLVLPEHSFIYHLSVKGHGTEYGYIEREQIQPPFCRLNAMYSGQNADRRILDHGDRFTCI